MVKASIPVQEGSVQQDNEKKHNLDDDILQCKQDILKAIRSTNNSSPAEESSPAESTKPSEPVSQEETDELFKAFEEPDIIDTEFEPELIPDEMLELEVDSPAVQSTPPAPAIPIKSVPSTETPQVNPPIPFIVPVNHQNEMQPERSVSPGRPWSDQKLELSLKDAEAENSSHIDDIRQELEKVRGELEHRKNENAALKIDLEKIRERIIHEEKAKEQILEELKTVNAQATPLHTENSKLQDQLKNLQQQLEQEQKDRSLFSEQIIELQKRIQNVQREKENIQASFEALSEHKDQIASDLDHQQKQHELTIQHANDRIVSLSKEKELLIQESTELQEKIDGLIQDSHQLQEHLLSQEKLIQQLDSARKKLEETNQYKSHNMELEDDLKKNSEELQKLSAENDRLHEEVRRLNTLSSDYERRIEQFNTQLQNAQEINSENKDREEELARYESALAQERTRQQLLQCQIQEMQEKIKQFETERVLIAEKLELAEKDKQTLQVDFDEVRREFHAYRDAALQEQHGLSTQLESVQKDKHSLKEDLVRIRSEYEAYQTQATHEINQLSEQYESLQHTRHQESRQIEKQNTDLKASVQKQQEQIEALNELHPRLELANQEILELTESKNSLLHEIEQVKLSHNQSAEENLSLSDKLEEARMLEQELRAEIAFLKNSTEKDTTDHNAEIESLIRQKQIIAEDKRRLLAKMEMLQESNHTLQTETERLKHENLLLYSRLDEIKLAPDAIAEDIESEHDETEPEDTSGVPESPYKVTQIPAFNLADQIMAEHRQAVSCRRQRVHPGSPKINNSMEQVVQQYIGKKQPQHPITSKYHDLWLDDSLSSFQREILHEIVHKDIESYSKKPHVINRGYTLMQN